MYRVLGELNNSLAGQGQKLPHLAQHLTGNAQRFIQLVDSLTDVRFRELPGGYHGQVNCRCGLLDVLTRPESHLSYRLWRCFGGELPNILCRLV